MTIAKSPSDFRFNAEDHTYWLGKKRIPGVSEILRAVGLGKDYANVDPFYRERGIAGHKCIELFLKGELDESTVDPCLKGHFEGFKRFWSEHNLTPLSIETARYNESYAGTIDLITDGTIWDWKFSKAHDRVADLQGEAYKTLCRYEPDRNGNITELFPSFKVVQFPGNGTYEITDYGDAIDTWPHVMELYRWKKKR